MHLRFPMKASAVLAALLLSCHAPISRSEPLSVNERDDPLHRVPLWEYGVFIGAAQLPQYNGSDEVSTYVVPIPYFVYRGKVLRSGRDGVKGLFYRGDHLQTDFAVSGSPPAARDNRAREGMPALGAMAEIGPALKYSFWDSRDPDSLAMRGAIRAAFSFDIYDHMRSAGEGFRATVDLTYDNASLFASRNLDFGASVSIDFIDDAYSDFFYGVANEYATDSRPFYEARGGYAGFSVSTYATKEVTKRLSVAMFTKWISMDDAAFEDSPLVKTTDNFVLGCALIWQLAESHKLTPVPGNDKP
jgi:outer membrane protein